MGSVGALRGVNLRATVSESHDSMDGGLPADQNDQGETDLLDTKLWHACAGPRVYVPRAGEKVCYFPQGQMEQVEAFTQQNDMMEMPIYNVPSKILCKVVHVHLKAEAQTDEVFAQVTLLPEPEQDKLSLQDETALASPQRTSVCSFVKKLTASDTSPHGGFSLFVSHMLASASHLWTCLNNHPYKIWSLKTCKGLNGTFAIFTMVDQSDTCSPVVGVPL